MKELKRYKIKPGHKLVWSEVNPGDAGPFETSDEADAITEGFIEKLDHLQEKLYAEHQRALLIVLQGTDTSGKDGTIRHVMRGVNPQGCDVTSFKVPTPDEAAHDFLWRVHRAVPGKGMVGIFNRSHYEDVLVTRVHGTISEKVAAKRYDEINNFERMLFANGTTILKFALAISKEEQQARLQGRLDDPHKLWKLSAGDLAERRYWDQYAAAYAEAISATSTKHAPWYVIPANNKWYRNYLVAKIVYTTLKDMDPKYPPPAPGINARVRIPS